MLIRLEKQSWRSAGNRMPLLAACLSALLLWISFPPHETSFLAWVALIPLFLALEHLSLLRSFGVAASAGGIFYSGIFSWIWTVPAFNALDYLLLLAYFSLPFGLFGLALSWSRREHRIPLTFLAPPLWVAMEYGRSHAGFLSAPWMLLGHSQYEHTAIIQITAWTGVFGISFLIVLVNAALTEFLRSLAFTREVKTWRSVVKECHSIPVALAIGCLGLALLYGFLSVPSAIEGSRLRIALIQGNIPQDRKWDKAYRDFTIERYAALTRTASASRPDLIVWPETAVPGDVRYDYRLQEEIARIAREAGSYLLAGSATYAKFGENDNKPFGRYFNNMVLFNPQGKIDGEYHKIRLVPFAEYTPLRETIRWPTAIARPRSNIVPGDEVKVFAIRNASVASTICWENIFPDLVREFVQQGARLVTNATNEAWFGESGAPYQFLAMSVFRAVENRVTVARAANTGVSAIIDPYGRIVSRLQDLRGRELLIEGALIGEVVLPEAGTFYTRFGDIFAFLQIALSAWLVPGVSLGKSSLQAPAHARIKGEG